MEQDNTQVSLSASPYIQKIQGEEGTGKIYIVSNDAGESERVFAITASEAIGKSAMEAPTRVLQYNPLNQVLVAGDELNFDDEAGEAGANVAASTEQVESAAAAAAATTAAPASEQAPQQAAEAATVTPEESAPPANA